MAGISSKAAGKLDNRYKFNDGSELQNREFSDGSGLELYETSFRSYDPQIGRFHQPDLLAIISSGQTPYNFALDNPIRYNDPTGLIANEENSPTQITGWVKDPNGKVYFDPEVHKQEDIKPGGGTYLGEEILIKDEKGNVVGYGNDQGGITPVKNLKSVTVTPANNNGYQTYIYRLRNNLSILRSYDPTNYRKNLKMYERWYAIDQDHSFDYAMVGMVLAPLAGTLAGFELAAIAPELTVFLQEQQLMLYYRLYTSTSTAKLEVGLAIAQMLRRNLTPDQIRKMEQWAEKPIDPQKFAKGLQKVGEKILDKLK